MRELSLSSHYNENDPRLSVYEQHNTHNMKYGSNNRGSVNISRHLQRRKLAYVNSPREIPPPPPPRSKIGQPPPPPSNSLKSPKNQKNNNNHSAYGYNNYNHNYLTLPGDAPINYFQQNASYKSNNKNKNENGNKNKEHAHHQPVVRRSRTQYDVESAQIPQYIISHTQNLSISSTNSRNHQYQLISPKRV